MTPSEQSGLHTLLNRGCTVLVLSHFRGPLAQCFPTEAESGDPALCVTLLVVVSKVNPRASPFCGFPHFEGRPHSTEPTSLVRGLKCHFSGDK